MKTKKCLGKCGLEKELLEFGKHSISKDGLKSCCKECRKEEYQLNKEKIEKTAKKWYQDNKEKALETRKNYRDENKQKIAKNKKKWYIKNYKKISEQKKEYYIKNREKIKKRTKQYTNNKLKNDIKYKILHNLRRRINHVLNKNNKSLSTMMLIGCEIDYLMYHIQNRFTKGMSWDNYGLWHIDHRRPCASFDLSKPSEQRKCFHFSNLQPLWAEDNFKKGSKIL